MLKLPDLRVTSAVALLGVMVLVVAWDRSFDVAPEIVPQAFIAKSTAQNTEVGVSPFGLGATTIPITSKHEPAVLAPAPVIELLTVSHSGKGRALAMLHVNGGVARQFVVGDVVAPGVRLTRILPGSIELQRGRDVERFFTGANQNVPALLVDKLDDISTASTTALALEPSIITLAIDQPAPSSNAVDRAIRRASQQ